MKPDWLPNLFICGVPKAGTSSLHRWLSDHPDAFGALDKEARFFMDPGGHVYRPEFNIANGLAGYRSQFPIPHGAAPKVILDSTPAYIYQQAALDHLPDLPGQPRCIFVLREPASQILSLFNYFQNNWSWIPAGMSFGDYLRAVTDKTHDFNGNELARNALDNAAYVTFLRQWRKRLGDKRMFVCTFDELRHDAPALTRRIARWAGLETSFYDSYDFTSENESYVPRSRGLQRLNIALREHLPKGTVYRGLRNIYRRLNTTRPPARSGAEPHLAQLREHFAPANAALAAEFRLDLSGWNAP